MPPLETPPPRPLPANPAPFLLQQKREIQGNPRKYLGASIWCQPYPNAGFQDACLGFYSKHDSQAITTWFLSPVK